jgi:hypothetical protein
MVGGGTIARGVQGVKSFGMSLLDVRCVVVVVLVALDVVPLASCPVA